MNRKKIGVFDSGVGGLTVVKHLINLLPNEDIVYFGDTARVPYGSRTEKTILKFAFQDIDFLKSKDVKIIVAACGTVSSVFLKNKISDFYFKDFFYSGVVEKTCEKAAKTTENKNIAILGTMATIKSKAYQICLEKIDEQIQTFSVPCPLFVPIVEQKLFETNARITRDIVDMYLHSLKSSKIDTLILGCTHYPILCNFISDYFDNKINLIDPGLETANFIKKYLTQNDLLNSSGGERKFYLSEETDSFHDIAAQLGILFPENKYYQNKNTENKNINKTIEFVDLDEFSV